MMGVVIGCASAGFDDFGIVPLHWALNDTSLRSGLVYHNLYRFFLWLDMGTLCEAMLIHTDGMCLNGAAGI